MCTVETHASCRHPVPTGSWLCFFHSFFFFNDPATTEIYTLSLHDALPICQHQRIWLHLTERAIADRRHSRRTSPVRSEEHTSELQSHSDLVCRLLLEKKKRTTIQTINHRT